MTWTPNKPTVPGWYWWRSIDPPATVIPALVFKRDNDDILRVIFWANVQEYLVSNIGGEWSGPLEPPHSPASTEG